MINVVLFGPPGAGKGTQSEKIISHYHLVHLSTGDLLRSEIKAGTELGLRAKGFMDRGFLVPDEVVIGMIEHKLQHHTNARGFIFDGFPRTVAQAQALDHLLSQHQTGISKMIALEVEEEELTQRILRRGQTSGRSDDQDITLVKQRVKEYTEKTAPLAHFYRAQGKFVRIQGEGTIEEIFGKICHQIDALPGKATPDR